MNFRRIFVDNFLHSTVFEKDGNDEFNHALDVWNDIAYLFDFFTENVNDLQGGFFGSITCNQAITQTRKDANDLALKIRFISQLDKEKQRKEIEKLFRPLDEKLAQDLRTKAYGPARKSWLRLYAIKIEELIIITGSAIKLTATMEERPHTQAELDKLRRVKDFLAENGVCDADGFIEMVAEL